MTRPAKKNSGVVIGQVTGHNSTELLDVLLALDRRILELSMAAYNIPRCDRILLRAQNRRLHEAARTNWAIPS